MRRTPILPTFIVPLLGLTVVLLIALLATDPTADAIIRIVGNALESFFGG